MIWDPPGRNVPSRETVAYGIEGNRDIWSGPTQWHMEMDPQWHMGLPQTVTYGIESQWPH